MIKKNAAPVEEKKAMEKKDYIALKDIEAGSSAEITAGLLWLKNGKYNPGVSVDIGGGQAISDWMRCIELRNVTIKVETNSRGYAQMVICGE